MVLNVRRNHKALVATVKMGGRGYGGGGRGRVYTYRYTVTTRMTLAFRWAAMRAFFNVPLIVRDKSTRQFPQTTIFEEEGEPKRIQTKVPLLTKPAHFVQDCQ